MRAPDSGLPILFDRVSLRAGETAILRDVSLSLAPGAPTVLIGPNGAGKTSLIRIAMGLQKPSGGSISWGGRPAPPPGRLAIVFQRPVMLRRSVRANIAFALAGQGLSRTERHARVARLLDLAALGGLADRPARRLSGGEQQRLALARALAREPEALFLDEPANNLDPAATKSVEALIRNAAASGIKIVMTTHDLGQARRLGGEIIFLAGGQLLERAPADRFFAAPATEKAAAFLRGDIVE
ncbi:MAG TPA: ATP-binding cassette domain-containing protein [Xanthobacteraceae bacterium]|nr:ATP-binding cassette domain-containing protein [Xanthobacteraceae bacterium]